MEEIPKIKVEYKAGFLERETLETKEGLILRILLAEDNKLPVILMAGDFDPDGRLETNAMKFGALAYIEKPFGEETLFHSIDKLTAKFDII